MGDFSITGMIKGWESTQTDHRPLFPFSMKAVVGNINTPCETTLLQPPLPVLAPAHILFHLLLLSLITMYNNIIYNILYTHTVQDQRHRIKNKI